MLWLLLAELDDILRFHGLIASAAFGVEELQQFLQSFSISGVTQESALASNVHQVFSSQFVEMVRKSGIRDFKFVLDIATTSPSGCADKSSCMMRRRGSVPIAESMSAYFATCSANFAVGDNPVFIFRYY